MLPTKTATQELQQKSFILTMRRNSVSPSHATSQFMYPAESNRPCMLDNGEFTVLIIIKIYQTCIFEAEIRKQTLNYTM
jgi:hypothetical protein